MSEAVQQLIDSMLSRAHREPLGVDVSDYSDEWCAGFLRGQTSALEELSFALTTEAALQRPTPCNCRVQCMDADDEEGTCKGLPMPPKQPLVEFILIDKRGRMEPPLSAAVPESSEQ